MTFTDLADVVMSSVQIHFQELAFVRFCVTDNTTNHMTAQRVIPLKCLRPGELSSLGVSIECLVRSKNYVTVFDCIDIVAKGICIIDTSTDK